MAKPLAVDFSGVESGGGRVRVPEDDYHVRVATVKQQESKAGNQMLVWDFEFMDGKAKGKKIRDRTVLTTEALWKLKQLLEAMGIAVPSKRVALDLRKYIGKELGVTVVDEEYEGKMYSKVSDYVSIDVLDSIDTDDEDEDEDEEEPAPKKAKKSKKAKKDEDEDEDIEELDLDEL
jgi:hypothetical protein